MKNKPMGSLVTLEDNLLSLFFSGLYLSNYDFVKIGKKLNFYTPLKGREIILKTLIAEAKGHNKVNELREELLNLIEARVNEYTKLSNSYENTSLIIKGWIEKANNLKNIVKEKLN